MSDTWNESYEILERNQRTKALYREIERLRAELQKTLDAGAVWERAYQELKPKSDEMRGLLLTAVDAWESSSTMTVAPPMYLSREWYDKARELTKETPCSVTREKHVGVVE